MGGIGPHSGEIWVFENSWNFAFWRTLASIISRFYTDIFDLFGPVETAHERLQTLKISHRSDEKRQSKVLPNFDIFTLHLLGLRIFSRF